MLRSTLAVVLLFGVTCSAVGEEPLPLRDLIRRHLEKGDPEDKAAGDKVAREKIAQRLGLERLEDVVAIEHTLLLKTKDGNKAVDPYSRKFEIGDELRFRFETYRELHLYVLHVGHSGEVVCVLPGANPNPPLVKPFKAIELPADGGYYEFTQPPVDETIVVVASEKPLGDLQALGLAPVPAQAKVAWRKFENDVFRRFHQSTLHGALEDEALRKLAAAKPEQLLLTEPTTEKRPSTFAAAIATKGKTVLCINIPINTSTKPGPAPKP